MRLDPRTAALAAAIGGLAWVTGCPGGPAGDDDTTAADDDATADDDTTAGDDDTTAGDDDDSAAGDEFRLWVYLSLNLQVDDNVDLAIELIDRAVAAGYTGLFLADFKIHLLHQDILPDWYATNLDEVLQHARDRGMEVMIGALPFGYSEGILRASGDLAEGLPVKGSTFAVTPDGATLELVPAFSGPVNGDLESHSGDTFDGWNWQDEAGVRTFADTAVSHGGAASLRIDGGAGNARIMQTLDVTPWRQVHVSYWLKTDSLTTGTPHVYLIGTGSGHVHNYNSFAVAGTQDWTRYDFVVNTMDQPQLNLYLGIWDGSAGTAWFDDVTVEETALVNLLRRDGAPLAARGPDGAPLVEGADLDPVADPLSGPDGIFDAYHAPPVPTVPEGSSLAPGDSVEIDHYAVAPIYGYQVGACLTDDAVWTWIEDNLAAMVGVVPEWAGLMLQYDEMRHLNSCGGCAALGLSAGELLAWHLDEALAVVRAARPDAELAIWSDMFDPHHNAVAGPYYHVQGELTGSWEGLPADVTVLNWNRTSADSLAWFEGRGHRQIVAGYYDAADGAAAAEELAAAAGVSGIAGYMYTTWVDGYDELEAYAAAILAARR